jgi:hypothetical protein
MKAEKSMNVLENKISLDKIQIFHTNRKRILKIAIKHNI